VSWRPSPRAFTGLRTPEVNPGCGGQLPALFYFPNELLYCTTTVPVIVGWMEQWYVKVPFWLNVKLKVPF